MKKIISLLITVVMVSGCYVLSSSAADSPSLSGSIAEKITSDPGYYNLADSVLGKSNLLMYYLRDENKIGNEYPDYFGGMYVENNGQELVVNVTELTSDVEANIYNFAKSKDVKIKKVKTSLNELYDLQKYITDLLIQYGLNSIETKKENYNPEFEELLSSIVGIGVNEKDNKVDVLIRNVTDGKIKAFNNYFILTDEISFVETISNSKEINDEKFEKQNEQSIINNISDNSIMDLYMGCHLYKDNILSTRHFSMGFRCTRLSSEGYVKGFITAGHGLKEGDEIYLASNYEKIGEVDKVILYNGANVDASFVKLDTSNYNILGDTVCGYQIDENYFTYIPTGSVIHKEGYMTGRSSGELAYWSINLQYTDPGYNNMVIVDCGVATYLNYNGDSGGIVYTDGSTVGIHVHNNEIGGGFVKAKNIYSAFDLYVY